MVLYDLPADLVEEILSRVPATSLKRLRSTCKRWNVLFKDGRFTEKHFRKAPKKSRVLMLKEYKICSTIVDLNVVPPSIEFKDALDLKDSHSNSEQVDIVQVFHCDGLLLCTTLDNKHMVCNPCLGETRWIQPLTGNFGYSRFALGYKNKKTCRSYKILRDWVDYKTSNRVYGFDIYEFTSDSWRVLNAPSVNIFKIRYNGMSLKGNTYWVTYDGIDHYLLSFDFTRERFRRLRLPAFQSQGQYMALSVVREEQLSVLFQSFGASEVEMWVTKRIDSEAELSWSKSFAVDLHKFYVYTSLLIDEEKKVALCCQVNDGYRVYVIGTDESVGGMRKNQFAEQNSVEVYCDSRRRTSLFKITVHLKKDRGYSHHDAVDKIAEEWNKQH